MKLSNIVIMILVILLFIIVFLWHYKTPSKIETVVDAGILISVEYIPSAFGDSRAKTRVLTTKGTFIVLGNISSFKDEPVIIKRGLRKSYLCIGNKKPARILGF